MATEEKSDEQKTDYVFKGSADKNVVSDTIVLKGSIANPEEFISKGDTVALTKDEVAEYKASGLRFTKGTGDDEDDADEPQSDLDAKKAQADQQESNAPKAGANASTSTTNPPASAVGRK